jgi:membrane-bound lytic murein transglycosylase B
MNGDSPAQLQLQARTAAVAGTVQRLTGQYRRHSAAAAAAAGALAAAFARIDSTDSGAAQAGDRLARASAARSEPGRDLYVQGPSTGGVLDLLTAGSPDDAQWQLSVGAQIRARLLRDAALSQDTAQEDVATTARKSAAAVAAFSALSQALADLREQQAAAQLALDQAGAELARLGTQARQLQVAREAAATLARAQAAAAAARLPAQGTATARGTVSALGIPLEYQTAYQQAATTCPGMDWTLLAAVGQVESGHGRNNGPSSAGAIGPMQFMPATFAGYAVDGNHDGVTDAWNPADAIFSAARYLCSSGAGRGAAGVHAALLTYNHAEWYVDLVLAAQSAIRAR